MKRECAICGAVFETEDPEQDVCPDCEIEEELADFDSYGEVIW